MYQDPFVKENLMYLKKHLFDALGYAAGGAAVKSALPNKLGKRLIAAGQRDRDGLIKAAQDNFDRIAKYIKAYQGDKHEKGTRKR